MSLDGVVVCWCLLVFLLVFFLVELVFLLLLSLSSCSELFHPFCSSLLLSFGYLWPPLATFGFPRHLTFSKSKQQQHHHHRYTTKPVKKGQIVLSDPPLMSISFGSQFCDHCGCQNPNTPVDAIDGYAKYCTVKCRSSAFSQYYAFMSSNESEGMSAKYALLRSQYNSAGSKQAPLTQSFHVLASLRICAITEQCKKRGELPPSQSTFDMPSFRCLLRPGDLGANILERSGFRLPFMDQYRAYEKVRDILPEALQKRANEYDMAW